MKKLVILGGGESGVGTAILGKKQGFDVFVSDFGKIKDHYKEILLLHKIDFEDEQHSEKKILKADLVMKSPGIAEKVSIVKKIIKKNIPIVSEIEFTMPFTKAKTIGITGSNGKTTTTMLTYHILKQAGINVGLAGNVGKSFAWQVADGDKFDWYVLELSSFQLDHCFTYKPEIAILTNLSPDHLDRYDYKYENYINAKFRIAQKQDKKDYFIYDADDQEIEKWLSKNKIKAKLVPFSLTKKLKFGAFSDTINMNIQTNEEFTMPISEIAIEGKHNLKNAMAASTVAQLINIRKQTIRESLADFQGVEHRLEKVLKINNVQYINDSKATNVNAAYFALESMTAPTVWIVGGVDKGNDYTELFESVNKHVKSIICLGLDNKKIIESFGAMVDELIEVHTMEEAVKQAYRMAEKGDNVLLAPACASFDLFENYEDRGRKFKVAVKNL